MEEVSNYFYENVDMENETMENETTCDYYDWEPFYVIPILYMLIFILGFVGNGVVAFTMWRAQGKRCTADVYMGNLALAGLLVVVTQPLWAVNIALHYHWPFGLVLCKISSYVAMLNRYASVFCLICMSFDRYLATITQPVNHGHRRASLTTIWLLASLLALPNLIFHTISRDQISNHTTCAMDFSMFSGQESLWVAGLNLFSTTLGYLLPFLTMTVCYCFIGCNAEHNYNSLSKEDQRERRLLMAIITLVLVYATCWMPASVLEIVDALYHLDLVPDTCGFMNFLLLAYPIADCLACLNSCLNPFLYAAFDQRFRSQCLSLRNLKTATPASILSSQKTEAQFLVTRV